VSAVGRGERSCATGQDSGPPRGSGGPSRADSRPARRLPVIMD
jgi:hypothetical protein